MAASESRGRWWPALRQWLGRWLKRLSPGVLPGLVATGSAVGAVLPQDKAELIYHRYEGGGVVADGPALLVRKNLADRVSVSAQYYVDAVSNASIDVVTTASPFKETRNAVDVGADWLVRDTLLSLSLGRSREPDFLVEAMGADATHEVFGGMTTVSLGFGRSRDQVGQKGTEGWIDEATRWQYRAGVTQILTPRWLASLNVEAMSDHGFLGSPYRAARVFGAAVPERLPRTRTSRAVKLRVSGDTGNLVARSALFAEYRYYWDTWDIRAHTTEVGASKYLGESFLVDAALRLYSQNKALFYSDNADSETLFVTRNRQLSTFDSSSFTLRATWSLPGQTLGMDLKLTGAWELKRFRFKDFSDLRTGQPYSYDANVFQVFMSSTF